jgi:hypothetical protein
VDTPISTWLVILLAVLAANLPFLNERLLAVLPIRMMRKPFWLRLIELTFCYAVLGVVAYALESRIGNAFAQGWEFFAITACFFVVLAYPGFVFCYLRKRHD